MPVFSIKTPDGRVVDIRAGDQQTAVRGAQQWFAAQHQTPAKPSGGIGDYVKQEAGGIIGGAWNKLAGDVKSGMAESKRRLAMGRIPTLGEAAGQTVDDAKSTMGLLGDAVGLAASPAAALIHGGVIRPAATVLANIPGTDEPRWEGVLGTAMMGAGPELAAGKAGALAKVAKLAPEAAPGVLGKASARASLADYARAEVDPTLAVSGGKTSQMAGQQLAGNALLGGPLRQAGVKTAGQLQAAVEKNAGVLGGSTGSFQSGAALKGGVEAGVGVLKAKASSMYDALKPLEKDPTPRPLDNTRASLDEAFSSFTTPELKDWLARKATDLAELRDVVSNSQGASYAEMKHMRGVVGGMMDDPTLISTGQNAGLKRVYGALTQDMQGVADSSGLGDKLRSADANYAQMKNNEKTVYGRFFGDNVTEQGAYERMVAMAKTKGAKASWPQLKTLQEAVGPDGWSEVASGVVRQMGRAPGADGAEGFSAARLATEWDSMSPEARKILFGSNPDVYENLKSVANVARDQQAASKFYNHSQSGNAAQNMGLLGAHTAAGTTAMLGHPGPLAGMMALDAIGYSAARLLASPGFAKIMMAANEAKTPEAMAAVQARIAETAKASPERARDLQQFQRALAGGIQTGGELQSTSPPAKPPAGTP